MTPNEIFRETLEGQGEAEFGLALTLTGEDLHIVICNTGHIKRKDLLRLAQVVARAIENPNGEKPNAP